MQFLQLLHEKKGERRWNSERRWERDSYFYGWSEGKKEEGKGNRFSFVMVFLFLSPSPSSPPSLPPPSPQSSQSVMQSRGRDQSGSHALAPVDQLTGEKLGEQRECCSLFHYSIPVLHVREGEEEEERASAMSHVPFLPSLIKLFPLSFVPYLSQTHEYFTLTPVNSISQSVTFIQTLRSASVPLGQETGLIHTHTNTSSERENENFRCFSWLFHNWYVNKA